MKTGPTRLGDRRIWRDQATYHIIYMKVTMPSIAPLGCTSYFCATSEPHASDQSYSSYITAEFQRLASSSSSPHDEGIRHAIHYRTRPPHFIDWLPNVVS